MGGHWLNQFLLAFIPLFVAIDPLGMVPLFLGITQGQESRRRAIAHQAVWTAASVAVAFLFLGRLVFRALGITVADFQIAGGLILFLLAARDLLGGGAVYEPTLEDTGIFPLGLPLIAGPALLTMMLTLVDSVGIGWTLTALALNMALLDLTLCSSGAIANRVGPRALRAGTTIVSLLLAAIAIHMIRAGWQAN